ncbi:AAA family ATPase [Rickettsiales endosymbiont of Trichoplax sp. H2]|uniref:AAA family ATPase n=1 Tax=Rickettsiales endosymbiont of Trichoplax sp. H2 TaxID=2021221 RepID=UPI0012B298C5|nr:AAA family ATPase [Rickettsiales endosymbiont of Trichoplax sp. H2]MSO14612.1 hypothetical protein [Rickettsiales endosymbiont of Trichoplax sp. H2]
MKLPIGISDFKEVIKGKYQFTDKSLLLKEVINDGAKVILITRPRRFGKTLNLSMLYYFLQQNNKEEENIFKNLLISEDDDFCKKHQNQYPVIFISFKDIKQASYNEAYGDVLELIKGLYSNHRYLLKNDVLYEDEIETFINILNKKGDISDIKSAIKQLTIYITRKFKKSPIILIDEYDTPVQEAYLRGYYQEMMNLMRSILGQALKDNSYLERAVITGITRVSQESLFSGLNHLKVYSLLKEKYGQYFGFTEKEVIKLIKDTKQKVSLNAIKEWYNGYQLGKYILYNPWSIINCLDNEGKLQPYWLNTSSNELIIQLLSKAKPIIKQQFEGLLQGKIIEQPLSENLIFQDIETEIEALWSLLLYAGYLKVLSSQLKGSRLIAKIAIPNKEVGFIYDKIVEQWFSRAISIESYDNFIQSIAEGNMDKFKMYITSYIMQSGSYFDFNSNTSEQIFHVFILGLVVGLRDRYNIHSNKESGLGRLDVICIPKDKEESAILLEFKVSDAAELLIEKAKEALLQIKEKQYIELLKQQEIKSVLAIGLAFYGKQMELIYEVQKI